MPRVNVKDKRKQQLIEANIASIAKRGLGETTIAHVSKGAGMSRGIVNFYFTSKEKMMQETLQLMAEDFTSAWKQVFDAERAKNSDSIVIAEAVLRLLMSDKLCSAKRMAVWTAFLGHAATHAPSARIIRAMDDTFTTSLKKLWLEAGYDSKASEIHARQLQALIRGHWTLSALTGGEKYPSAFIDAWVELLSGEAPAEPTPAKDKVVKMDPKPKKKTSDEDEIDQLNFGDLFSN